MHKKEVLVKFLKLIQELSEEQGNEWFKNELSLRFSTTPSHQFYEEPSELVQELKRTKFFLKHIDKSFNSEGFKLFKKIKDPILKSNLIIDYKEMKIAIVSGDVLEFGRRMILQLERCFDSVIIEINGWEKVKEEVALYQEVKFFVGQYENKMKITDGFFKTDFSDKTKKIRKDPSEIEFKIKALFCCIYYQIDFTKFWSNLLDIYFLRNKASHGSLTTKDLQKLNNIIEKFPEKQGFYFTMFFSSIKPLKDIYTF